MIFPREADPSGQVFQRGYVLYGIYLPSLSGRLQVSELKYLKNALIFIHHHHHHPKVIHYQHHHHNYIPTLSLPIFTMVVRTQSWRTRIRSTHIVNDKRRSSWSTSLISFLRLSPLSSSSSSSSHSILYR